MTHPIDNESIKINNRVLITKEIKYIEAKAYLSTIYFYEDSPYTVTILLGKIQKLLSNYPFIRVRRNIIINSNYFNGYVCGKRRNIITKDGTEIQVSESYWGKIKSFFSKKK